MLNKKVNSQNHSTKPINTINKTGWVSTAVSGISRKMVRAEADLRSIRLEEHTRHLEIFSRFVLFFKKKKKKKSHMKKTKNQTQLLPF